jgi:hypothetical protein
MTYPNGENLAPAGQRPEDPAAPSLALTDEEIAEFRRLRAEDEARRNAEDEAARKAEAERPGPSHYLHLADGSVIESAGTMTHYRGMLVLNSTPIEDREEVPA